MNTLENISLKNYNTFGIDVIAKRFITVNSFEELKTITSKEKDIFLIGGGSNMLLTSAIDKLVVHINTKGIIVNDQNTNDVFVTAEAGENWHDFVTWCVHQNYGGLENLSLIPGNVGTSPIQNIGAYGVELKDTFYQLEALEIETGKIKTFTNTDCKFGYRNSVFKNELKGKYIILNVTFKLTKIAHKLNISYGAIKDVLKNIENPSLKDISEAVISIRESKLPDPKKIGNSGSFFKNPIISKANFEQLIAKFPNVPHYVVSEKEIKIPAGWLIEQSGFKGKRYGNYGVHENQALVLVNYGNATGNEIFELASLIQKTIKENFHISLEIEVNVI